MIMNDFKVPVVDEFVCHVKIITRAKTPDNELATGSIVREGYPHQAGSAPSIPPDVSTELTGNQ